METVIVNEEEIVIQSAINGSSSSSSSTFSPKPNEVLHDLGTPPFLTKIFDMVEDPSTDPIISWSNARNSFIVWDSYKLSTLLLPKFFKHANFSSFVRQLNTYGFRKVDPDRWEFANEGFLGGQKHLLKNIKRRRNVTQSFNHQGRTCVELGQYGLESEIERLKRDCTMLMTEIVKLRQQQQFSRQQLVTMETRLQSTEKKQQQMMTFVAKALVNPTFVQNLIQEDKHGRNSLEGVKSGMKRRLTASPNVENLTVEDGLTPESDIETFFTSSDIKAEKIDGLTSIESDIEALLSKGLADGSKSDTLEKLDMGNVGEMKWEKIDGLTSIESDIEALLSKGLADGSKSDTLEKLDMGNVGEMKWEELLYPENEDEQAEIPVENVVTDNSNWDEAGRKGDH